jgi:hypothetical protein
LAQNFHTKKAADKMLVILTLILKADVPFLFSFDNVLFKNCSFQDFPLSSNLTRHTEFTIRTRDFAQKMGEKSS